MKVAIAGFSFASLLKEGKMDVFHYLETLKYRFHLGSVDLWNGLITEQKGILRQLPDEDYLKKIKHAIDEKEMTLVNFAIDGAHIWDPDPHVRDKLHENALAHLKAAKILGAKTVRIDTGGYESQDMSEEQFELMVKTYQVYCEIAADNGFLIGPENHMGPSLVPDTMKNLAEAIDHPNYGILLHANRWHCEDQQYGNSLLAPWAFHVHVDPKRTELSNATQEIGLLKNEGYDKYWAVEYNPEKNQFTEIEWALASFKKSLANSTFMK